MTQLLTMGERIRAEREANGLTQSALAGQLGIKTYATISKWESNDNVPRQDHLISLTEIFGVSADYLLGLDEQRSHQEPVVQASSELTAQTQGLGAAGITNDHIASDDNTKALLEIFNTLKVKHQQKVIKYAKKQAKRS